MLPVSQGLLKSGERIAGRYLLLECIGDGGHAAVWSALDEQLNRSVALKFLRPDCCDADEAWAVLQQESQLSRRVDHPGVLWVDEPQREGDLVFLPMEHATGGDIKSLRGAPYQRSVPTLIRVAHVLAHAHARGVIHRDIKAGNVLLDALGEVRLADFGSAADAGSQRALAAGSPFSASPQQLQGAPATPADDIYGLGALAYELLSGYPPFYPDFNLDQVLTQMPTELRPVHPVPPQLTGLVMAMLARDPAARPADMQDVTSALQSCLTDMRMIEEVGVPVSSAAPRAARCWPTSGKGIGLAAAAVVALFALVLITRQFMKGGAPVQVPVTMAPVPDIKSALEPATDAAKQGADAELARAAQAASEALAREIGNGRAALAAGQVAVARAAFDRALRLQPQDPGATQGLADATRLERVLAVHSDAVRAEAAGQLQRAAELFTNALQIDTAFSPAKAGLARVRAAQLEQQFELALRDGNVALQAGNLDAAQSAYSDAARLRPSAAQPRAGLAGVADARRKRQDASDQQAGIDLEKKERWVEAVALYESAVARDPQLAFARQGLERSRARAALAQQLDDFVARPERLAAAAVRSSAEQAIARAAAIGGSALAPTVVLEAQVARVRVLLAPYAVPAHIEISSDNSTRIFIARVGDLGAFLSRELNLPPGRYTVIGTRAGFRDVRRELNITPGQRTVALSVQCTERI
jgi:eukaryotic-like serine/threonine-protein kinase